MSRVSGRADKMTNKEILEKAIQRAIDGGWIPTPDLVTFEALADKKYKSMHYVAYDDNNTKRALIFNHDFAKALWGDEQLSIDYDEQNRRSKGTDIYFETSPEDAEGFEMPTYLYRLQQMVIADDPIKYLGENI